MSDLIRAAIASVDEVAVTMEGKRGVGQLPRQSALIRKSKQHFPGAVVTDVRDPRFWDEGDEIPW